MIQVSRGRGPDREPTQVLDGARPRSAGGELVASSQMMRLVLDTVPVRMFWKDRELRYLGCNLPFALDAGFDNPEDLLGKSDFDMGWADQAELYRADDMRVIDSGEAVVNIEEPQTTPDKRTIWLRTSKIPLLDASGSIIGVLGTYEDISDRKAVETELEQHRNHLALMVEERTADLVEAQRRLVAASHQAGRAEVATTVLHNVGNVLNSVNVATGIMNMILENPKGGGFLRAIELMEENRQHLDAFVNEDPRGGRLFDYMRELVRVAENDRSRLMEQLATLSTAVDHISAIVRVQQDYAGAAALVESCAPGDIVDDAVRISAASLERHGVAVERRFAASSRIGLERQKILQVLVNLITNASEAIEATHRGSGTVSILVEPTDHDMVRFTVEDDGVGIAPEHLPLLCRFGFTTRPNGHGFGLHGAANAAIEMGGTLVARSDGVGKGASFALTVPAHQPVLVSPVPTRAPAAHPGPA